MNTTSTDTSAVTGAGVAPTAPVVNSLNDRSELQKAFKEFQTSGKLPAVGEGAYGARYQSKSSNAAVAYNEAAGALTGKLSGKLSRVDALAGNSESIKDMVEVFKEAGLSEKEIERSLASNTREMQRAASGLGRDLRRAVKDHTDALAKLAKGQADLTKDYARTVLKAEFDAVKSLPQSEQTAALSKLESQVTEFTDHLRSNMTKRIDFHKDSIEEIKNYVSELGEKGVKIELEAASIAKATETAAQATGHLTQGEIKAVKASAMNYAGAIGGVALAADGISNLVNGEEKSGGQMAMRVGEAGFGVVLAAKNVPPVLKSLFSKGTAVAGHLH